MAHFAEIDENNIVTRVLVVNDADAADGQNFLANTLDLGGTWIQTSYNTRGGVHYESDGITPSADQSKALRKNFGSVDSMYNSEADGFHQPQPYPSWTLNATTFVWECPVAEPDATADTEYVWNETDQSWDAV